MNIKDTFFTTDEQRILEKNSKILEDTIGSMIEDGIPKRSGDIRVLKELIEASSNRTIELAKLRLKNEENNNGEALKELVLEVLKRPQAVTNTPKVLKSDISDTDLLTGEIDINPPELDLDKLLKE